MTADREVLRTRLIDAMLSKYGEGNSVAEDVELMLDAALALRSPCQTCGGDGDFDGGYSFLDAFLGDRAALLATLGMEPVGYKYADGSLDKCYERSRAMRTGWVEPVWAARVSEETP